MNTTTRRLTAADLDDMENDPRWLGHGYLGERGLYAAGAEERGETQVHADLKIAAAESRLLQHVNAEGWTYEDLFAWANSRAGRHFADCVFGGTGYDVHAAFHEAVRFGLLAKQPGEPPEDLEAVLERHRPKVWTFGYGGHRVHCTCGWEDDGGADYTTHLTTVLKERETR